MTDRAMRCSEQSTKMIGRTGTYPPWQERIHTNVSFIAPAAARPEVISQASQNLIAHYVRRRTCGRYTGQARRLERNGTGREGRRWRMLSWMTTRAPVIDELAMVEMRSSGEASLITRPRGRKIEGCIVFMLWSVRRSWGSCCVRGSQVKAKRIWSVALGSMT